MQPKIFSLAEHNIALDQIDSHAYYVIEKLRQAGHTAYLVGGGVRDLLLKKTPKDFDVSTEAKPEEIRALFRNAILIGRRFRLAHIRFGKKIIEVATFRAGDSDHARLIVQDNIWGSEEEDVLRRDFTINGLFYNPEDQTVIDYVDGFEDVQKKILRTIGHPKTRFIQDPVRMIRLVKFLARFDLYIHPSTHEALLECKSHIINSAPARILEELFKMLESSAAEPFFRQLHQYGLLRMLIAPMAHFMDLDPLHRIEAMLQLVDFETRATANGPLDRSLLLAALIFPIFEMTIHHLSKHTTKTLHLGIINEEAYRLIDNLFAPFFHIPRRLQAIAAAILSAQFRLTPLNHELPRHPRIPNDEAFSLAIQLLKIRANQDTHLMPTYTFWTEALFRHKGASPLSEDPTKPRRRRKLRPT